MSNKIKILNPKELSPIKKTGLSELVRLSKQKNEKQLLLKGLDNQAKGIVDAMQKVDHAFGDEMRKVIAKKFKGFFKGGYFTLKQKAFDEFPSLEAAKGQRFIPTDNGYGVATKDDESFLFIKLRTDKSLVDWFGLNSLSEIIVPIDYLVFHRSNVVKASK